MKKVFKIALLIFIFTGMLLTLTGCQTLRTIFQMGANGATWKDFLNNAGPLTEQAIEEAKPMVGDVLTEMGEAMEDVGEALQDESCSGHCECTCGGCPASPVNQDKNEQTETQTNTNQ